MATVTMTIATPTVVTHTGHGFVTGKQVGFSTTGALPTGVTALGNYYVRYIDANSYYIANSRPSADLGSTGLVTTFANATETFTSTAHGLSVGMTVMLTAGTMPTGYSAGTTYYVIASGLTANDFKLALTQNGTAVNGTTNGSSILTSTLVSILSFVTLIKILFLVT